MNDNNTDERIRKAVRQTYGDIARCFVAGSAPSVVEGPARASCCGPSEATTENTVRPSCCGPSEAATEST
ncbi:MAG: hypothetical protein SWK90_04815, partial [Chloroflexota bacterium]|nr:hypothetical protein [Chloroflexota bacterium]